MVSFTGAAGKVRGLDNALTHVRGFGEMAQREKEFDANDEFRKQEATAKAEQAKLKTFNEDFKSTVESLAAYKKGIYEQSGGTLSPETKSSLDESIKSTFGTYLKAAQLKQLPQSTLQSMAMMGQALLAEPSPQQAATTAGNTAGTTALANVNTIANAAGMSEDKIRSAYESLIMNAGKGGKPALLQVAEAYMNGTSEERSALELFGKVNDKGFERDEAGSLRLIDGLTEGKEELSFASTQGEQKSLNINTPLRAAATQAATDKQTMITEFPRSVYSLQSLGKKTEKASKLVDSIIPRVDMLTTGIASLSGVVPGTPAFDLKSDIDTLLALTGFEELSKMRAESPTGGALGQIAVRELEMLQAVNSNIQAGQSPPQLRKNLATFKTNWENMQEEKSKIIEKEASRLGLKASDYMTKEDVNESVEQTKTIGDKTYIRKDGKWFEL